MASAGNVDTAFWRRFMLRTFRCRVPLRGTRPDRSTFFVTTAVGGQKDNASAQLNARFYGLALGQYAQTSMRFVTQLNKLGYAHGTES